MARKPKEPKEEKRYPGVRPKNGKFTYRYSIPAAGKKGRIQKETPSYATAKEAFDAGILIKATLLTGTYFEDKEILFSDYSEEFIAIYEARGKAKKTTIDLRKRYLKKTLIILLETR